MSNPVEVHPVTFGFNGGNTEMDLRPKVTPVTKQPEVVVVPIPKDSPTSAGTSTPPAPNPDSSHDEAQTEVLDQTPGSQESRTTELPTKESSSASSAPSASTARPGVSLPTPPTVSGAASTSKTERVGDAK